MSETISLFCVPCNAQIEAQVIAQHTYTELAPGGDPAYPVDSLHYVTVFTFAACKRCGQPFLTEQCFNEIPGDFSLPQDDAIQIYPQQRNIPLESIPGTVSRPYLAALTALRVQLYEPCVIMCRKCVEALCSERGASKGNLSQRLVRIQQDGKIDKILLTWADGLRMIGNDAAHDLNADITIADAKDAIEFVEAILLYVFVLQERFSEFQNRRLKKKSAGFSVNRELDKQLNQVSSSRRRGRGVV